MKRQLLLLFTLVIIAAMTACSGKNESAKTDADSTQVTEYDSGSSAGLIEKAKNNPEKLTQEDYAKIIEQCSAINRKVADKLKAIDFTTDMTDEQLQAALKKLNEDPELPVLEAQSRDLLVILQRADLDDENSRRYDAMVAEAAKALNELQ